MTDWNRLAAKAPKLLYPTNLAEDAELIKISTGKTTISATPEANWIMLEAISDAGRPVNLKPSGGIRTLEQAITYLDLVRDIMGPRWASPKTFRFGASVLLDDLLARLDCKSAPQKETTY